MLSTTARYALGVLRYLASNPKERIQALRLAQDLSVPGNYLSKVLNQLRKQGFLTGRKGWTGGYQLNSEALNRNLGEVIKIFEGQKGADICILSTKACNESDPCPAHEEWSRIQRDYRNLLTRLTIRDLAGQPLRVPVKEPVLLEPAAIRAIGMQDNKGETAGLGLDSGEFLD